MRPAKFHENKTIGLVQIGLCLALVAGCGEDGIGGQGGLGGQILWVSCLQKPETSRSLRVLSVASLANARKNGNVSQ